MSAGAAVSIEIQDAESKLAQLVSDYFSHLRRPERAAVGSLPG